MHNIQPLCAIVLTLGLETAFNGRAAELFGLISTRVTRVVAGPHLILELLRPPNYRFLRLIVAPTRPQIECLLRFVTRYAICKEHARIASLRCGASQFSSFHFRGAE